MLKYKVIFIRETFLSGTLSHFLFFCVTISEDGKNAVISYSHILIGKNNAADLDQVM